MFKILARSTCTMSAWRPSQRNCEITQMIKQQMLRGKQVCFKGMIDLNSMSHWEFSLAWHESFLYNRLNIQMSQRDWGFYITAKLIFPERIAEMRSGIRSYGSKRCSEGSRNSARFIRWMSNFGIGDLRSESQVVNVCMPIVDWHYIG